MDKELPYLAEGLKTSPLRRSYDLMGNVLLSDNFTCSTRHIVNIKRYKHHYHTCIHVIIVKRSFTY